MNSPDTGPLKYYAIGFRFQTWMWRLVKGSVILALAYFAVASSLAATGVISGRPSDSLIAIPFILIAYFIPACFVTFFVSKLIEGIAMGYSWNAFASRNKLSMLLSTQSPGEPAADYTNVYVPSFRGKFITASFSPVRGTYANNTYGLFSRQYKEGGIIRWREHKMDTVLWIDLAKPAPHIVVDARLNERARRSNLSSRYNKSQRIHFEGSTGDKYDVYAAQGNETAALQLFTPDVLDAFFSRLPKVDIEVKGSVIWFVHRYGILSDKSATSLFVATAEFMQEFSKQLTTARFTEQEIVTELAS